MLYYDRISKQFSLVTDNEDNEKVVIFLGPLTHTLLRLQHEQGLTPSQAREATLRAYSTLGAGVCLEDVKKIA